MGTAFDQNSQKMFISGDKESSLGFEVSLESGLLPVAWKSLDQVSCNSSYDRWGLGALRFVTRGNLALLITAGKNREMLQDVIRSCALLMLSIRFY